MSFLVGKAPGERLQLSEAHQQQRTITLEKTTWLVEATETDDSRVLKFNKDKARSEHAKAVGAISAADVSDSD